jgi:hypothetical protein
LFLKKNSIKFRIILSKIVHLKRKQNKNDKATLSIYISST